MADLKHKLHYNMRSITNTTFALLTNKGTAEQDPCSASSRSAILKLYSEILQVEPSKKRLKSSRMSCQELPRSTALHQAVELADERSVRAIVRREPNLVDVRNRNGETALHLAARHGYKGIAAKLVLSGANTRLQNLLGHTPLHVALYSQKQDTASVIVDEDPGNVTRDVGGDTPLHLASQNGYVAVVRDLLAASFNTFVQNQEGLTPLHVALCCRKEDVATVIIDTASVNEVRDRFGDTPLHYAAREGYVGIVRKMLAKGVSAHIQGQHGRTPLHVALFYGKEDVANAIINSASVNEVRDKDGDTPLHLAAREGFVKVVRKLLAAGVDAHLQGRHGFTPLHAAMFCGEEAVASAIIDKTSVKDVQIEHGDTLLHLSLYAGFQDVAKKLLLRHNVHPHVRNNRRRFPLEIALELRMTNVVKVILVSCALKGIAVEWNSLNVTLNKMQYCPETMAELEAEVQLMKQIKLAETSVSYYDVVRAHVHRLAIYLKNEDIRDVLFQEDVSLTFPNYAELIALKVRKAEVMRILRDQWLDHFAIVTSKFHLLPITSIELILVFLSAKDLKNFIKAFNCKT